MSIDLVNIDTLDFDRVIALSDIHGDLQALDALLSNINLTQNDLLITLGDYVDRGHFSAQVLDRLIEMHKGGNVISLRGNHDQWMIDARDDEDNAEFWLTLGGSSTLASYEEESIDAVPDTHWDFLTKTCVDIAEAERHIFVHGYVEYGVALKEQIHEAIQMLQHQHGAGHDSGKIIVCGHSSTQSGLPEDKGHTIAIETKIWLNAVDLNNQIIWRADSNGLCDEIPLI
ncbi:MAG: metallophosphoesterase [Planctomycetota bacterium]